MCSHNTYFSAVKCTVCLIQELKTTDSVKLNCFLTTAETLTLSSHFMHIPYRIPIYDYKRNTMTCLNFILNCMSLFLMIFLVNIPLMEYRNVSPTLMENHTNTQALLLFISQQHHRF